MSKSYDFAGWVTRANLRCTDGRIIMNDAFKDCDGKRVPLVWAHQHNSVDDVLGHMDLENRGEGVYGYGYFNETDSGQNAKELVRNGDVTAMSIYANQLKQEGSSVRHGVIREVSLVLAGANPGAFIDSVMMHADGTTYTSEDEAQIYTGKIMEVIDMASKLKHADQAEEKQETPAAEKPEEGNETIGEIFNTLSDKQKKAVYAIVGSIMDDEDGNDDEEDDSEEDNADMKHNVFDTETNPMDVISHDEMTAVITDARSRGSMKDAALAHGITNIGNLFPEAQTIEKTPEFYKRDTDWVSVVMNGVHRSPFSRVKSTYADITADDARARGYVKGNQKVEETIAALKRVTTPTTIYKLQKLDRDDVIDITDFDVVAWIKGEMRMMLDEEIARAILVGDGRSTSSNDKINEQNIRPIWKDDEAYTIHHIAELAKDATQDEVAIAFIRDSVKSRKDYKGSGNPILFTTEDHLTNMLLLEDRVGRRLYDTVEKLATAMRVSRIITVPVMEGLTRTTTSADVGVTNGTTVQLAGIIVNLGDYNVGADRGGEVNLFDDFDINYNKQEYLIETRCSGAMIRPKSAIALEYYMATT